MSKELNIYEFIDYREFIKEYYLFKKSLNKGFSYRVMSRQMGFTSPNYIKLIVDGDRHISLKSLDKLLRGLNLNTQETTYFKHLVNFAKAKDPDEKEYHYYRIIKSRAKKLTEHIHNEQYEYYDQWYNIAIREIIAGKKKSSIDYKQLASFIIPSILPSEAKKAVETLERIGMIKVDSEGYYRHTSAVINTSNEVNSFSIIKYHEHMIELGKEALTRFKSDERDISSATLKISEEGFRHIKSRLHEFREEILQIARADKGVDRISQVNLQLFPLSDKEVEDE